MSRIHTGKKYDFYFLESLGNIYFFLVVWNSPFLLHISMATSTWGLQATW